MPQFPRQSLRPPVPEGYRAAARKLRRVADVLEVYADQQTPKERRSLTLAIHGLAHMVRALVARHNRRPVYPTE